MKILDRSRERPFTPFLGGSVSAANGGSVDSVCRSGCAFQPDARKPLYVDGLICYHSCCQVLQLNLTARIANQAINIREAREAPFFPFWGRVEMRCENQCVGRVRERPFYPLLEGSVSAANGSVDSVCRSGCAFQPDARKPLYVDGLICYHSCCQVLQLNLTARIFKPST